MSGAMPELVYKPYPSKLANLVSPSRWFARQLQRGRGDLLRVHTTLGVEGASGRQRSSHPASHLHGVGRYVRTGASTHLISLRPTV